MTDDEFVLCRWCFEGEEVMCKGKKSNDVVDLTHPLPSELSTCTVFKTEYITYHLKTPSSL